MLAGFGGAAAGGFTLLADELVSAVSALDVTGLDDRPVMMQFSDVFSSVSNSYLHMRYSDDGGASFVSVGGSYSDNDGADGAVTTNGNQIPLTGNIAGSGRQFEAAGVFWLHGFGVDYCPTILGSSYYGRGANVPYRLGVAGRFVDSPEITAVRLAMSAGNMSGRFRFWRLAA